MTHAFASLLVAGALDTLTFWSLSFMIAAGLTVVFGMLGFLNAAHTAFYMLAGYAAYAIVRHTGSFWLALALAPVIVALIGVAVERLLFTRLYRASHASQLLLTIGLAYIIAEGAKIIWGDSAFTVAPPPILAGRFSLLGATLPIYHLFIISVALVLLCVISVLLVGTRLGMVVRAAAVYPEMVGALGFKVRTIYTLVFAVGLFLAACAGVVMAPLAGVYPGMADDALVQSFIIVVAGGLGSLPGAFIVAGLLGVVQGFGSVFFSSYAIFFPFIVLGGVLLVRPHGLFGGRAA
ncbi:branched-chain amino acid ABC transporter permease [Acidisoma cellulosilyticum]|nr:branched-chain amino acid ABC transporter permease [Acidisoma cellulosilyticum]